jgi:hypothetical protein
VYCISSRRCCLCSCICIMQTKSTLRKILIVHILYKEYNRGLSQPRINVRFRPRSPPPLQANLQHPQYPLPLSLSLSRRPHPRSRYEEPEIKVTSHPHSPLLLPLPLQANLQRPQYPLLLSLSPPPLPLLPPPQALP